MLTFQFTGVDGVMSGEETLTSGMIGKTAAFSFDDSWVDLQKIAVFVAGGVCRTAEVTGDTVAIPADVLLSPCVRLYVGVYGTNEAGDIAIPTIMVKGPRIDCGADPCADPVTVEMPIWKKLQEQIGDLAELNSQTQENLVAAINEVLKAAYDAESSAEEAGADGATFTPSVSAAGDLSWTNDRGLDNPETVNIMGPAGADGKSAYACAQEAGYGGTETEFAEKLAAPGLPAVTGDDEGKVLMVVDGVWAAAAATVTTELPSAEEVSF